MWRQVVSQTPQSATMIDDQHPYAKAAAQLNRLIRGGRSLSGNERNCAFLNTGKGTFATASSLTGFDFKDDGRAVAECDWDFDGDIDFWVANRTEPQLRFLENTIGSKKPFVSFRLRGTRSNRDAIGACVQLHLEDGTTLLQAIRAGEGFLTQSSKLVHFGLGTAKSIKGLTVRWPNGSAETFPVPPETNRFYSLVEGSGRVDIWQPPSLTTPTNQPSSVFSTTTNSQLPTSQATANTLCIPFPLPPLPFTADQDKTRDATNTQGKPLAINLMAAWCSPCIQELTEWQSNESMLREAGIQVLAISTEEDDSIADKLRQRGIKFPIGVASETMLETIQSVHNTIYDHHQRIPIPTTLLLNEQGQLVALFKGKVTAKQLVNSLQLARQPNPDSRLPFAGRWIGKLAGYRLSKLASELWDQGYTQSALTFAERLHPETDRAEYIRTRLALAHRLREDGQIKQAMAQLQSAHKLAATDADVNLQIGILQAEYGKLPVAAGYFLIALKNAPEPRADIHANLGSTLRRLNDLPSAEKQLTTAIKIDPRIAVAHYNLGLLFASQSKLEKAKHHFHESVRLKPNHDNFRINYAIALSRLKQFDDALRELDHVLQNDPESTSAKIYKGEVYAEAGQTDRAIAQFEQVAKLTPNASRVWMRLGQLQEQQRMFAQALASYESAYPLAADDPRPAIRIAWILSTAPQSGLRDGKRAKSLVTELFERARKQDPLSLASLAAAHAECDEFEQAVAACKQALSMLGEHDAEFRNQLQKQLKQYQQGRKFRAGDRP